MWAGSSVCHRLSRSATEGKSQPARAKRARESVSLSHPPVSLAVSLWSPASPPRQRGQDTGTLKWRGGTADGILPQRGSPHDPPHQGVLGVTAHV